LTPTPSRRAQRCPDCGAACERVAPDAPLTGSALWACVEGEGDELLLTRSGEVVKGRIVRLQQAPRFARIGRRLHTCEDSK